MYDTSTYKNVWHNIRWDWVTNIPLQLYVDDKIMRSCSIKIFPIDGTLKAFSFHSELESILQAFHVNSLGKLKIALIREIFVICPC